MTWFELFTTEASLFQPIVAVCAGTISAIAGISTVILNRRNHKKVDMELKKLEDATKYIDIDRYNLDKGHFADEVDKITPYEIVKSRIVIDMTAKIGQFAQVVMVISGIVVTTSSISLVISFNKLDARENVVKQITEITTIECSTAAVDALLAKPDYIDLPQAVRANVKKSILDRCYEEQNVLEGKGYPKLIPSQ